MRTYRIKQTAENKFIPQVKLGIFGMWNGIDGANNEIWYSDDYNEKYCYVTSLEIAHRVIAQYKTHIENKPKFPIIHKV
jgi:hypothetical protein